MSIAPKVTRYFTDWINPFDWVGCPKMLPIFEVFVGISWLIKQCQLRSEVNSMSAHTALKKCRESYLYTSFDFRIYFLALETISNDSWWKAKAHYIINKLKVICFFKVIWFKWFQWFIEEKNRMFSFSKSKLFFVFDAIVNYICYKLTTNEHNNGISDTHKNSSM